MNIYLYPITARNKTGITNPYMEYLSDSLSSRYKVINKDKPSRSGSFDFVKYLGQADLYFLNWIEDLPTKKGGIIQSFFYFGFLLVARLTGKKILWTLHNKKSHSGKHAWLKSVIFWTMTRWSDMVLTHASEGLTILPARKRSIYLPHPVKKRLGLTSLPHNQDIDILIWGTIAPYKGVDSFLNYLHENGLASKYTITIAGKISTPELRSSLNVLRKENIHIIDRFLEMEELQNYMRRSKIVLFTYHSDSILSSGALMDSLELDAQIIGPRTGAFKDLSIEGLVHTYAGYPELIEQIDRCLNLKNEERALIKKVRESFIEANSWGNFALKLGDFIERR